MVVMKETLRMGGGGGKPSKVPFSVNKSGLIVLMLVLILHPSKKKLVTLHHLLTKTNAGNKHICLLTHTHTHLHRKL